MRVIDNDGTINKMQWIYRYPREKRPDIDKATPHNCKVVKNVV